MEILITHLTRMRGERSCVAGLTEDGEHVRPLPGHGDLVTLHRQLHRCVAWCAAEGEARL